MGSLFFWDHLCQNPPAAWFINLVYETNFAYPLVDWRSLLTASHVGTEHFTGSIARRLGGFKGRAVRAMAFQPL